MASNPDTGDILFFTGNTSSKVDRLIMWRTKSKIVHVAIALSPTLLIQAESGGVRIRDMSKQYTHILNSSQWLRDQTYTRGKSGVIGNLRVAQLLKTAGAHYGWADILTQLLTLLPWHPSLSLDKSYDCSHLATDWLQSIGYPLPFGTEGERITPADLFTTLQPAEK